MENKMIVDLAYWSYDEIMILCGIRDKNLNQFRKTFQVELDLVDNQLYVHNADEVTYTAIDKTVNACFTLIHEHKQLKESDLTYLMKLSIQNPSLSLEGLYSEAIAKSVSGKMIYPKTIGQRILMRAMESSDIVFASGVAGTGKTYLAVVYAVDQLKKGNYTRIVLTRPAVEAGENLGFLPGDLKEKVDPYLRPLYDALYDMLGSETVGKLMEKEVIEIAPLAYMRGRTLDNAFIILDEAQNTTKSQMKMFLTRMGFNSKMVITGDTTQIDLIKKQDSGLFEAISLLKDIEGIRCIELSSMDVVRHPLVSKIIECYERKDHNE